MEIPRPRTVVIYALCALSLYGLFDFLHAAASKKTMRILALGDSLTAGFGVDKKDAYPALLQQSLAKSRKVEVVNAGISGSTSASAVSRLNWQLKNKPDLLILALGINDALRGLDLKACKNNLSQAIKLAKKHDIKVLLAGMKLPPNYGKKYAAEFEAIFPALAKEHKIALIPFLLKGVGGVPKMNLADGIHPNQAGHKVIAKTVETYLEPIL